MEKVIKLLDELKKEIKVNSEIVNENIVKTLTENIDYTLIEINYSELADYVADRISYQGIAECLDEETILDHVQIDYKSLAKAILTELKESN